MESVKYTICALITIKEPLINSIAIATVDETRLHLADAAAKQNAQHPA
jgi:hypothetical protein